MVTPRLLLVSLVAWAPITFVALMFVVVSRVQREADPTDPTAPLRRLLQPSATQIVVMLLAVVLVAARIMLTSGVSLARTIATLVVGAAVVVFGRSLRRTRTPH